MDQHPSIPLRLFRRLRRAALLLAGAASILGSVALVWLVLRPDVLPGTPTVHLLALLGLLVLPMLSIAGWAMDRRQRHAAPVHQARVAAESLAHDVHAPSISRPHPAHTGAEPADDRHRRRVPAAPERA